MNMEEIIKNRIEAIKTAYASNRIEGAVDEVEHLAMLERAKEPISEEEFVDKEISRIYARYGIEYVK